MSSTRRSQLLQVLSVLLIGVVAFGVRSALQGDPPQAGNLPVKATADSGPFAAAAASNRSVPEDASIIATAKHSRITLHSRAGGGKRQSLKQRVFEGQKIPLTFLVSARKPGWVRVELPTRPNLAKAWVRRGDVRFSITKLSVVVRLSKHRLELRDGKRVILRAPVAVGRSISPTPRGTYFVTDIVKPKNPRGFYGTYSLGLSAHSTVYTSFGAGDGQVGLHGTNKPSAIGSDVSHGCIRVTNAVVSKLAKRLPLGTPVVIRNA